MILGVPILKHLSTMSVQYHCTDECNIIALMLIQHGFNIVCQVCSKLQADLSQRGQMSD